VKPAGAAQAREGQGAGFHLRGEVVGFLKKVSGLQESRPTGPELSGKVVQR
jgi:hypothetical protein